MAGMRQHPQDPAHDWDGWGPYLAERAWGTVREDYSEDGQAWTYLPHDHARSRAYRWNEEGMAGVCDSSQRLCLALALWNGRDPILKERMFGHTGPEGSHGEDVKEHWWYTDAVPSHSWLEWKYAYPLDGYPYERLASCPRGDDKAPGEFELLDTGVFAPEPDGVDGSARWADVTVQIAKADVDDIVVRVHVENMSVRPATVHLLPTLWFRNTWSWNGTRIPSLRWDHGRIVAEHHEMGSMVLTATGAAEAGPDGPAAGPTPLFCDNESNAARLWHVDPSLSPAYPKDGINDHVTRGTPTVNPELTGTKSALWYRFDLEGRASAEIVLRLSRTGAGVGDDAGAVLRERRAEADEFHASLLPPTATAEERLVHRQAIAGLIWCKQYYPYDVTAWLEGDGTTDPPPPQRRAGRNAGWWHVRARDVISMPDSWEYPWFAAWDLAFHAVAFARFDPEFAKRQLLLMLDERYQHPDGQIPAYEWNFGDVNPPVHAWAALSVFRLDGGRDWAFLEKALHKLLLNFTWWVNRKDVEENNLFEGGFLGMDNIGPVDRSRLPEGVGLEQSDATAWMAMFCLDLLEMSLLLASRPDNDSYEDLAIKFLEHFAYIATALRTSCLWNHEDGFYYDALRVDGAVTQLRVRSMAGLLPLFSVRMLPGDLVRGAPGFRAHLEEFLAERPACAEAVVGDEASGRPEGCDGSHLLAVVRYPHLARILARVFDEGQFLAPTGVRALSKEHADPPFTLDLGAGRTAEVGYEPAESESGMFGGNSNWRGPVWFPVNHLLVEALRRYAAWEPRVAVPGPGPARGPVPDPRSGGRVVDLNERAEEISRRLVSTFLPGDDGVRPVTRPDWHRMPPAWRDRIPFHEYFHADTGAGLGASHQTGWTALVIDHIATLAEGRAARDPAAAAPLTPSHPSPHLPLPR